MKRKSPYLYHILCMDFFADRSDIELTIEHTTTHEKMRITLSRLANNMSLLKEFSPEDIFTVAYLAGQQQMVIDQKHKNGRRVH